MDKARPSGGRDEGSTPSGGIVLKIELWKNWGYFLKRAT
jgi:hypothetical protein